MGANISSSAVDKYERKFNLENILDDLPKDCVAMILTYFEPYQICRLAQLNKAFCEACNDDFVWESILPSNYKYILERVFGGALANMRKKDIYARLCKANLFDDNTKFVWLRKRTGGVYYSISSKAMEIEGKDDPNCWSFIPTSESRYETVAYLKQTKRLEVKGQFEFKFPAGRHALLFRLRLGKPGDKPGHWLCDVEHLLRWGFTPVKFQMSTSDGQYDVSQFHLVKPDSWVFYSMGDFIVEDPNTLMNIKFSLTQKDKTRGKADLSVDSILIYPSGLTNRLDLRDGKSGGRPQERVSVERLAYHESCSNPTCEW